MQRRLAALGKPLVLLRQQDDSSGYRREEYKSVLARRAATVMEAVHWLPAVGPADAYAACRMHEALVRSGEATAGRQTPVSGMHTAGWQLADQHLHTPPEASTAQEPHLQQVHDA